MTEYRRLGNLSTIEVYLAHSSRGWDVQYQSTSINGGKWKERGWREREGMEKKKRRRRRRKRTRKKRRRRKKEEEKGEERSKEKVMDDDEQ
jgi:hypothetical protein